MTAMDHAFGIIMAGGGGTRLWPLSRQRRPKHMLPLLNEHTLFQATVTRLQGLFPPERLLVVTTAEQRAALHEQAPFIPAANFLPEPAPRGTAAVVALAAVALRARAGEQALMGVFPADHHIGNPQRFHRVARAAFALARQGYLVTLGIEPTYPATGYGYIQQGEALGPVEGWPAYRVQRFKEKPDLETARRMLAQGGFAWNSGMFFWTVGRIWDEFARQMPDIHAAMERLLAVWNTPARATTLQELWPRLRTETVDYGIMEGAQDVAVIPAQGLAWSDIGSWEAVWALLPHDDADNAVAHADALLLDGRGNLVYGQGERLVALVGVRDLVVVDTPDALLILPRGQAQRVREVVQALRAAGRDAYL